MKEKLNFKSTLLVGSLLFGLFFGAGNLIFPVQLGQLAGANTLPATIGFLITGVGLPILGVIASALSKSESLYDMAQPVNRTDRKSTRLNSSHVAISYAVFCLKKKTSN